MVVLFYFLDFNEFLKCLKLNVSVIVGLESIWEGEGVVSILFSTTYGAVCQRGGV